MRLRRILARYRVDPVLSLAADGDFLRAPGRSIDAARFRALRPTPYALDPRRRTATFVVVPDPRGLIDGDFFNQGQFERASHALTVPFDRLAELAEGLPALDRPILLYNTGRCGSTALVRVLHALGTTVGLSEPDPFAGVIGADDEADAARALDLSSRILARSLGTDDARVVFKLRGFGALPDPVVRRAFPDARRLFLYRDGFATVASGMRSFRRRRGFLALFDRLARTAPGRALAAAMLRTGRGKAARLSPEMARVAPERVARAGGAGLLAVNWVSAVRDADARGIATLRYESLVADPATTIGDILERTGLRASDAGFERAVRIIEERRDPHVGGRLDPRRHRGWTPSPEVERAVRELLAAA